MPEPARSEAHTPETKANPRVAIAPSDALATATLPATTTKPQTVNISTLLGHVIKQGGSDLHLNFGSAPAMRKDGRLVKLETKALEAEDLHKSVMELLPHESQRTYLENNGSVDSSFDFRNMGRYRLNICKARGQYKVTLRPLPSKLLTPEQIGFPEEVLEVVQNKRGLFLVTGPTGSGKTTTLAGIIKYLSDLGNRHIIMIEEPTEYLLGHGKGLVTQREVGKDVPSFTQGLYDALRENPDVIVLGELRGPEMMRTALTAAETGHLVLGTLHTTSAARTVTRLLDEFLVAEREQVRGQLSTTLLGALCQQLVPKMGDKGLVAVFEYFSMTSAISNLIRMDQTHKIDDFIKSGKKDGMQLLDDQLLSAALANKISAQDAVNFANDRRKLRDALGFV